MNKSTNGQAWPPMGKRLPSDWQANARAIGAAADAAYMQRLSQQWRQPLHYGIDRLREMGVVNLTQGAKMNPSDDNG
jgi:hypothetical protein